MNFTLNCETPEKFVASKWQHDESKSSVRYLIYRWIIACYFVFVFILSLVTAGECQQLSWYMIYLTNWNVVLNTISSLFMVTVLTLYHKKKIQFRDNDNFEVNYRLSNVLKTSWGLWILSLVVSVSLSLVYWPFIYTGVDKGLNDALTHAGNAIVNTFDLFVVAIPPRFGLFLFPLSFGVIYSLGFSLPYALAGGLNRHGHQYIYTVTDWLDKPTDAMIFTVATLAFLTFIHFVLTCLMHLREKIHQGIVNSKKMKVGESEKRNQHERENHDNATFSA